MTALDIKDRKILYELDLNCRQSFNALAKKVGLSKDTVRYRIAQLQSLGIIQRFHTVINVSKLGFISFRLYLKFYNTTQNDEEKIISYLKQRKEVAWLVSIDGEYDLGMWILVRSIQEMNIIWKDIHQKFGNHIAKRWLTIMTKVPYYTRAYLLTKKHNDAEFPFITEEEKEEIDPKSWKLLELLAPDARISILELAQKTKLTPKTVIAKIRDLEKRNIIVGYRTMFDIQKLGFQYFKIHADLKNITPEKIKKLKRFIKGNPYIIYDNEILGGDDLELDVQVESIDQLRVWMAALKNEFSDIIRNLRYMVFYKEHKYVFMPQSYPSVSTQD